MGEQTLLVSLTYLCFGVFFMIMFYGYKLDHTPNGGLKVPFESTTTILEELEEADKQQKKILLLTSARSGSSFVGYLFASNPEVFYMFEPLRIYSPEDDATVKPQIIRSALPNGYKCINASVGCRLDYLFSCRMAQYFKEAQFRRPENSKLIMTWYDRIFAELQRSLHIKAANASLDILCEERFNIIAAKSIRVFHIEDILPLIEKGLKVIYLLRDPRGVVNSRLPVGFIKLNKDFTRKVREECDMYNKNIDLLLKGGTDNGQQTAVHRNIALVRYEDIIQDLYGMATKMYQFTGLDMPKNVVDFAKSNARVSVWGKPNPKGKNSAFNETRELQTWRTKLDFTRVREIQDICNYSMTLLGYNAIENASDMKNLNYSVIGKVHSSLTHYIGV